MVILGAQAYNPDIAKKWPSNKSERAKYLRSKSYDAWIVERPQCRTIHITYLDLMHKNTSTRQQQRTMLNLIQEATIY